MELTPHMLDDRKYVLENAAKLTAMGTQLTSTENVMKENKPFFDSLSPEIRQKLNEKLDLMASFGSALSAAFRSCGINSGTGEYRDEDAASQTERADALADYREYKGMFHEQCAGYLVEQERKKVVLGRDEAELKDYYLKTYNAYFPNGATDYHYEALKTVRDSISKNPERYEANKELLDHFYQEFYRALGESGRLTVKSRDYMKDLDPDGRLIRKTATKRSVETGDELQPLARYVSAVQDVLLAILRDLPMPKEAQKLLADYRGQQAAPQKAADGPNAG